MDLSSRSELGWLSVIIADIKRAAPGFDALLVGATARDLILHHAHGVPVTRATSDVDLAFALSGWDQFEGLKSTLLESEWFSQGHPVSHRLVHHSGIPIDLIPFGELQQQDGSIVWPHDNRVMLVVGYEEAWATAVELRLPDNVTTRTVCLPMLAILKLISWSERHAQAPRKDAADFFLILSNYLSDGNVERLYEDAAELLERDDFDYDVAVAWIAGRDGRKIVEKHSKDQDRIVGLLNDILSIETDPFGPLTLVGETGEQAEQNFNLLSGYREGFGSGKR